MTSHCFSLWLNLLLLFFSFTFCEGQELPPLEMEKLIKAVGRVPVQRTTLYNCPPAKQIELSLNPLELRPLNK